MVAQEEREQIRARTKVALAATKARGVQFGCPTGATHLKDLGNPPTVAMIVAKAQPKAEGLRVIMSISVRSSPWPDIWP